MKVTFPPETERAVRQAALQVASQREIRKLRNLGRADGLRIGTAFQQHEDVLHNERAREEFDVRYPQRTKTWKAAMFPVYDLGFFEGLPSGN